MSEARPKRGGAGSRLERLLENEHALDEEPDDFWAAGGKAAEYFKDDVATEDKEFEDESEEESAESADSDIDEDESDDSSEEAENAAVQDKANEKAQRVAINKKRKAYVDPALAPKAKRPRTSETSGPKPVTSDSSQEEDAGEEAAEKVETKPITTPTRPAAKPTEVRSLRKSTVAHSQIRKEIRAQEEEEKSKRKPRRKPRANHYVMTQEQMLAEAKSTARANLESLRAMEKIEDEKKKVNITRPTIEGEKVTWLSKKRGNFVIWSDPDDAPEFDNEPVPVTARRRCDITGQVAKYVDPLTGRPYATLEAFKLIRQRYNEQHRYGEYQFDDEMAVDSTPAESEGDDGDGEDPGTRAEDIMLLSPPTARPKRKHADISEWTGDD